jgi:hypothetical protein
MGKDNEIVKKRKLPKVDMSDCNIDPGDAFMVVTIAMLQEPFMSSDCKQIVLHSALDLLKTLNYSEEDVSAFKVKLNEVIKSTMTVNDFMG